MKAAALSASKRPLPRGWVIAEPGGPGDAAVPEEGHAGLVSDFAEDRVTGLSYLPTRAGSLGFEWEPSSSRHTHSLAFHSTSADSAPCGLHPSALKTLGHVRASQSSRNCVVSPFTPWGVI